MRSASLVRAGENTDASTSSTSSSSAAQFAQGKFEVGFAQLPYYDDIRGAPHHTLIGGAGLWAMAGKKPPEYKAVARFLRWLARPEVQAEWHQRTGYVPLTRAASLDHDPCT